MSNTWFTADWHFGHANIIKHCKRPFAGVHEMNSFMTQRINELVKVDDTLYVLGDMTGTGNSPTKYLEQLACSKIYLIRGNHDCKQLPVARLAGIADLAHVTVEGQQITLCHYSMRTWNQQHRGSWQLYGHSHGKLARVPGQLSFDVGVDAWGFEPIPFSKVKLEMAKIKLDFESTLRT